MGHAATHSLRRTTVAALLAASPSVGLALSGPVAPQVTPPPCQIADPTGQVAGPLNYPIASDQYAVQYQLNGGVWVTAFVYESVYGGTIASPYHPFSGYPDPTVQTTSMSFVSLPVGASAAVSFRVTKLSGEAFPTIDHVSIRPRAKAIHVSTVTPTTVSFSTTTGPGFNGEQFILFWDDGDPVQNGGLQGLAFFLDPQYQAPTGPTVERITSPDQLLDIPAGIDTLDFEGIVGGDGPRVLRIPGSISTVYLGPGAWLRGKLRFDQSGRAALRRLYGPGVIDASRFDYTLRQCRSASDLPDQEEGYQAWSYEETTGPEDFYSIDGVVVADYNYYSTAALKNSVVNNTKIIGWNGNNDGFQFGALTQASNVFVRTSDDSLKMWDASITVRDATVWQNFNGGVVNLGWTATNTGDYGLIDGLFVVKTDWQSPDDPSWIYDPQNPLSGQNNAIIASMQAPGTIYGKLQAPTFRNIFIEDPPRVLFSLKILPPDCDLSGGGCPAFNPTAWSVLNLNVENVFTPAPLLGSSIGFQSFQASTGAYETLPGSMTVHLANVLVTLPDGRLALLSQNNAAFVGQIGTNGDNVSVIYNLGIDLPFGPGGWFSAWGAPQGALFGRDQLPGGAGGSSVRTIVRPVASGPAVRVRIENINGTSPVTFSAASIGVLQSGAAIVPGSIVPLTFNDGSASLTLQPGLSAYSDPLPFPVTAFTRYVVTLDVAGLPDNVSGHDLGLVSNFVAAGAHAGVADWSPMGFTPINQPDPTKPSYPVYWVAGLDVASPSTAGAVIALGDSITDGRCSTDDAAANVYPDLYLRWTDLLAARLAPAFGVPGKAVVNEGIAGNTVFGGGLGDPALVRLDRDVLLRSGATHVIFFEGTNDIFDDIVLPNSLAATVTTGLISADQLVIDRAHEAGLKIIGATIIPRGGDPTWTQPMENVRTAVNTWIRQQANFDGLIDFDSLMSAAGAKGKRTGLPAIPPSWACPDNDGVHPNAAGYAAMAGIINLRLFR